METTRTIVTASRQQQAELNRKWEEAGIGNDYIFSCVMRDKGLFLRLMQRIFPELQLTSVTKHTPQMTFLSPMGSKSVRFDVYSEIDDRVFDVEMQLESRGNESRRTRYYQCMMDEQALHSGEDYADLPDSYVVMISPRDLFHQKRHIYRFRNYEQTDRNLELRDGTVKVFLNTHGVGDDVLPELKNFLNLINGDAPADEFCAEVDQRVQEAKLDAETRRNFMEFEYMQMLAIKDANEKARREVREEALKEGREEGLAEGRAEGRAAGKEETYASLVQRGVLSIADAVKWSGLSEAQLRKRMK